MGVGSAEALGGFKQDRRRDSIRIVADLAVPETDCRPHLAIAEPGPRLPEAEVGDIGAGRRRSAASRRPGR